MAAPETVVALLSIHPRFAEAILSGEKRVEFRKADFSREVTHVIIYATRPVGAVVGFFETDGTVVQSPGDLWKSFARVGGIGRGEFDRYYAGRATGVAIKIKRATRLENPVPLARLRKSHPPQSFNYLPANALALVA